MVIEGLVLEDVPPGYYTLTCLPLKVRLGDVSRLLRSVGIKQLRHLLFQQCVAEARCATWGCWAVQSRQLHSASTIPAVEGKRLCVEAGRRLLAQVLVGAPHAASSC